MIHLDTILTYVVLPMVGVAILLIGYRFLKGPKISDRILCSDMLFTLGTAVIALYGIKVNNPIFLDIALMFALIAFLSTVAFSYYLVNRHKNNTRKK
ncbi:cation:proton antiporter [Capnocytophaga catalasegens]|uniref:Cation:proton antiporter n=1 Tax=Capnocytophaga catalasegens TaxID=1004260 RepID=A0AAV5AYL5_9FLAO|nr:cation:proton antiporter [Capnocytophaga catalasegens]GIZ15402.1 cation:proton antiporter [Capnocytophaga catalasegens]GJM50990.1 cation:proton antiporter [Capnocytophaga catalasegens]GJM52175.1 cation:proton antiporter [Capnocytophaga catalasegens]